MATTGELKAIIQELELVDIGDAASYLGEEAMTVEESPASLQLSFAFIGNNDHVATCNCFSCQLLNV